MTDTLNPEAVASLRELGEDFLADLVRTFLEASRDGIARMRRALEAADGPEIREAAHSLRGACLVQGAREMAELSRELERQGDGGDLAGAAGSLDALERSFLRTEEALSRLLPRD